MPEESPDPATPRSKEAGERPDSTASGRAADGFVWLIDRVLKPILGIAVVAGLVWGIVLAAPAIWHDAKSKVVSWTDPLVGTWWSPDHQDVGFVFKGDRTLLFSGMRGFPGSTPPEDADALSEYVNLKVEYTKEEKSLVVRTDYRNTKAYRERGLPLAAKDGIKIEVVPYVLDGDVLTLGGTTLVRRR